MSDGISCQRCFFFLWTTVSEQRVPNNSILLSISLEKTQNKTAELFLIPHVKTSQQTWNSVMNRLICRESVELSSECLRTHHLKRKLSKFSGRDPQTPLLQWNHHVLWIPLQFKLSRKHARYVNLLWTPYSYWFLSNLVWPLPRDSLLSLVGNEGWLLVPF